MIPAWAEASRDDETYSMDLLERVVTAVLTEGMTRHAAAARFEIAISSAIQVRPLKAV